MDLLQDLSQLGINGGSVYQTITERINIFVHAKNGELNILNKSTLETSENILVYARPKSQNYNDELY